MTTFKFQVGQKYMMLNHPVTVTRRTDKTIWFDFYGETFSRRVKLLENKEYVDYDQHHSIFSPNETSNESQDDVTEPQYNQDELVKTIKRNKERLNKSLLQLAALEEYQELTYDRLLHNINSIAEDIKRLEASKI
jgi:secreted PhoX family phosphatase